MNKQTKIVATIGPASADVDTLSKMIKAGMNVARLNFSHGTYKTHKKTMLNIRAAAKKNDTPVAILADLQGPKIRLGVLPEKGVLIKVGQKLVFDTSLSEYKGKDLPVTYPGLQKFLKTGQHFLIDDGHIEIKIEKISGSKIQGLVIEGEKLSSHKGLNFPDSVLKIPSLSKKDVEDLEFGIKNGVDFVALSFVHTAEDIIILRKLIQKIEKKLRIKNLPPILIVAKIEQHEAVEDIDNILQVVDCVMVARGDLGLETPEATVPVVQKTIINKARELGRPVIVATQMLDSMQHNRRPTRAEVSDVANAVIDHTDAVMLSNETATGDYPVLTVKTMAEIIVETEKSPFDNLPLNPQKDTDQTEPAVAKISRFLANEVEAKAIAAASLSGNTGRLIARVRPSVPLFVATNKARVERQLSLSWGVRPFLVPTCKNIKQLTEKVLEKVKKTKIVKKSDKIVIVQGSDVGRSGDINGIEIKQI